jgi:RNA recognition motif-containing protein
VEGTVYVGNLKWEATEEDLRKLFEPIGAVSSVKVIMDRATGKPRGFAFVTLENAEQAIQDLNGVELLGRPLKINKAEDKPPRRDDGPRQDFQSSPGSGSYSDRPRRDFGGRRDNFKRRDRDSDGGNY